MANDYGVYTGNAEDGTIQWLITQDPFELTDPNETKGCIDNLSDSDAEALAGELGEGFAKGRPKDRQPH